MYNESRKKKYIRFLAEDGGNQRLAVSAEEVFAKTERTEADLGMDLCVWPTDYAETVFSSPSYSPFPDRFYQSLMIVLSYTGWCYSSESVQINPGLLNIRPKGSGSIRKRMVSGETDLQNKLDLILGDERADTFDTVIRAFAWLSFAGVKTKDMESVRREDVDLSIPAVVLHERFHAVSEFALYSLRFSAESDTLVSLRSSERVRRVDCDALSRNDFGAVSGEMMEKIFQRRSRAAEKDDSKPPSRRPVLSFESIFLSGVYCDIRREELKGRPMDDVMKQFYHNYSDAVAGKRSDKSASKRITINQQDENLDLLMEDYTSWKLAFLPTIQQ